MLHRHRIDGSDVEIGYPFNFAGDFTGGGNFQSLIGHVFKIGDKNLGAVQPGDKADDAGLFPFEIIKRGFDFGNAGAFAQAAGNTAVHHCNNFDLA
jgi:hypothetical protein